MKPFIGVSCNFAESKDGPGQCTVPAAYTDAVQAAQGVPIIVAPVDALEDARAILDKLDGVIFTGGADIRPHHYGEEMHPKAKLVSERREKFDLMLVKEAIQRDMPVMAICYGCQLLNVAFGGSLYQDVLDQIGTEMPHTGEGAKHKVKIEKGTRLWDILKSDEIETNSSHHQSVKTVAEPVIVSARAEDGVIEAIESTAHRHILGIQWHPERLTEQEKHMSLFQALVEEAARR